MHVSFRRPFVEGGPRGGLVYSEESLRIGGIIMKGRRASSRLVWSWRQSTVEKFSPMHACEIRDYCTNRVPLSIEDEDFVLATSSVSYIYVYRFWSDGLGMACIGHGRVRSSSRQGRMGCRPGCKQERKRSKAAGSFSGSITCKSAISLH